MILSGLHRHYLPPPTLAWFQVGVSWKWERERGRTPGVPAVDPRHLHPRLQALLPSRRNGGKPPHPHLQQWDGSLRPSVHNYLFIFQASVAVNHEQASGCFNKNRRGKITNASSLSHITSGSSTRFPHVLFPSNLFDLSHCSFSENVSWHPVYLVTLPHNFVLTQKLIWGQKGPFLAAWSGWFSFCLSKKKDMLIHDINGGNSMMNESGNCPRFFCLQCFYVIFKSNSKNCSVGCFSGKKKF